MCNIIGTHDYQLFNLSSITTTTKQNQGILLIGQNIFQADLGSMTNHNLKHTKDCQVDRMNNLLQVHLHQCNHRKSLL